MLLLGLTDRVMKTCLEIVTGERRRASIFDKNINIHLYNIYVYIRTSIAPPKFQCFFKHRIRGLLGFSKAALLVTAVYGYKASEPTFAGATGRAKAVGIAL